MVTNVVLQECCKPRINVRDVQCRKLNVSRHYRKYVM